MHLLYPRAVPRDPITFNVGQVAFLEKRCEGLALGRPKLGGIGVRFLKDPVVDTGERDPKIPLAGLVPTLLPGNL